MEWKYVLGRWRTEGTIADLTAETERLLREGGVPYWLRGNSPWGSSPLRLGALLLVGPMDAGRFCAGVEDLWVACDHLFSRDEGQRLARAEIVEVGDAYMIVWTVPE